MRRLVLLTSFMLAGCAGGLGPSATLAGRWSGTWSTGSLSLALTEDAGGGAHGSGSFTSTTGTAAGIGVVALFVTGTHANTDVSLSLAATSPTFTLTLSGTIGQDGNALLGRLSGGGYSNLAVTLNRTD